jgi:hypothetical protein
VVILKKQTYFHNNIYETEVLFPDWGAIMVSFYFLFILSLSFAAPQQLPIVKYEMP